MDTETWLQSLGFEELGKDETTRYYQRFKEPFITLDYTDDEHYDLTCSRLSAANSRLEPRPCGP